MRSGGGRDYSVECSAAVWSAHMGKLGYGMGCFDVLMGKQEL